MGILRLLLSLSVLFAHSYTLFGYRLLGAQLAVDTFFVISGFYMALILRTKYVGKNGSYSLFITNRFLRIYPLYWVMLLLTFLFAFIHFYISPTGDSVLSHFLSTFSTAPYFIWTGIDTVLRNITLLVSSDYVRNATAEPGHLLILQAWTLQVEVLFYLLAPFLVKLRSWLLLLCVGFFALISFGGIIPGVHATNWIAPAFMYSLVFFLTGILSFRLYEKVKANKSLYKLALPIFLGFIGVALIFGYALTAGNQPTASHFLAVYFLLACLSLPFIFLITKNNSFDAFLGSLSYPVYISHYFIFKLVDNLPISTLPASVLAVITLIITLLFSYLLLIIVERPLDRYRAARLKR